MIFLLSASFCTILMHMQFPLWYFYEIIFLMVALELKIISCPYNPVQINSNKIPIAHKNASLKYLFAVSPL